METKRARSSGNSNAIPVTIESNTFGTNKFDLSYKRYHIVDTAMYMCTCEPSLSLSSTLSLYHSLTRSLTLCLSLSFTQQSLYRWWLFILFFFSPRTVYVRLFNFVCMCAYTFNAPDHAALLFIYMYWCLSSPWIHR